LANLQYISIIRLFQHSDVDYISEPFNTMRAKKQLQAEFAMQEDGIITIDDFHYNKSDVLLELEHPQFEERLKYHVLIWNKKQVLNLLEKEEINMDTIGQELNELRKDQQFISFFSPYFEAPFNNMCRSLLHPPQFDILGVFLKMQQFLLPENKSEAFANIRLYLAETDKLMRNTNTQNYVSNRAEFTPWLNSNWHSFVNMLPEEYYEEKNDLARSFINLTVDIQKSMWQDCKIYSDNLVKISGLDANLRGLIIKNNSVFNSIQSEKEKGDGPSGWTIFWIILVIIRIILAIARH
jgi:hypothetical protein